MINTISSAVFNHQQIINRKFDNPCLKIICIPCWMNASPSNGVCSRFIPPIEELDRII